MRVVWAPQPGSQELFLACPIWECLFHGCRGGGKTDALLMSFAQYVGRGYGQEWRGVIFRRTFKQLGDVVNKSKKWFPKIFPRAAFNSSDMTWTFPGGETLLFRYLNNENDYLNYHGHAYPFIAFEELTNWPNSECYTLMMSCNRSTTPGIPLLIRATCNPSGPGHNWVKDRFELHDRPGEVKVMANGTRCAIFSHLRENKILLSADPNYVEKLKESSNNPARIAAWVDGSWEVTSGGMFDDLWNPNIHIVDPVNINNLIESGWRIDRSFDWGSSRPFSVGWHAESPGGEIIRVAEWYGCTKKPNEGLRMLAADIAKGVLEREAKWGVTGKVKTGPADTAIWGVENGNCIAQDFERLGVRWLKADKGPGSRKAGWETIRQRLADGTYKVTSSCKEFIRTVPSLPRDDGDPDDVDSDAEDHIADEVRYRLNTKKISVRSGNFR